VSTVAVKIVTYNIASGASPQNLPGDIPFDKLRDEILAQEPDVVLLQEVHENWPGGRQPIINQIERWPAELGMKGHYQPDAVAWNVFGTRLGSAGGMILSKWPIIGMDEERLPSTRGYAISFGVGAKVFSNDKGSVLLDIDGKPLRVANMHLDFHLGLNELLKNYMNWLDRFPEPTILAGDSNLSASWFYNDTQPVDPIAESARMRYEMIPSETQPLEGIDWVMLRKQPPWIELSVGEILPVRDPPISDHPLVHATVTHTTQNNAQFETQSVPEEMEAGQSQTAMVTMRNTGESIWPRLGPRRLGSEGPRDNGLWGPSRVEVPTDVSPGETATFQFDITAPGRSGNYLFQWRMLEEGVERFGDFTPPATIRVSVIQTTVPSVVELSSGAAGERIREAGLVPRFSGPEGVNSLVWTQRPPAGRRVDRGSTVACQLRRGQIP
jgi:endonuclease/exonuclease/phosphatase family metal-dependent hydrolase